MGVTYFKIIKMKFIFSLIGLVLFFIPGNADAAGLGEAGSITLEGLVIGLAVLGVVGLVFMGLVLMARVRELKDQMQQKKGKNIHFKPEDVMNMDVVEIGRLLNDRNERSLGK